DGLELALEGFNTGTYHAEAVAKGALEQQVYAEALVVGAQRKAQYGIGQVGPANRPAVVIVNHAIAVDVPVFEIAGLYGIFAERRGRLVMRIVLYLLYILRRIVANKRVAERLVYGQACFRQPGIGGLRFILEQHLVPEILEHQAGIEVDPAD